MIKSDQRLYDAHNLVYRFIEEENIPIKDYIFSDFTSFIIDKYNIKFKKYDFNSILNGIVCGATIGDGEKWLIHVNSNMYIPRQNFTLCHELAHFIWDCDFGKHNFVGQSLKNSFGEDEDTERLADNAAGVIMIPDICIKQSIEYGLSFHDIMRKYNISHAALKIRLIQFLMFHLTCPLEVALDPVKDFMEKRDPEGIKFFFDSCGFSVGNKVDEHYISAITAR